VPATRFSLPSPSVWDSGLADYAGKKAAYGQAWPNGFNSTSYNGTYWPTPLIPMPADNFWD
jgi:hypothetical protein